MSNRPKLRELAYMLGVYSQKTIPQTYINELSNYELLLTIMSKINEIIERCGKYDEVINEIINYLDTLDDAVIDYLEKLKDSGYIAEQVMNAVNSSQHILMIGDSYLAGIGLPSYESFYNPPSDSYGRLLQTKGINVDIVASPGAGFYWVGDGGNFSDCLDRYSGEKTAITDIIVLGGSNDYSFAPSSTVLETQIILFCNKAKTDYPNARIHIGWLSQMNYPIDYKKWNEYKAIYKNNAIQGGYISIANTEFILKNRNDIGSDLLHPTSSGHAKIANFLYSYVQSGASSVDYTINNLQLTKTEAVRCDAYTLNFAINMNQHNGMISIDSQQNFGFVFNSQFPITLNGKIDNAIYLGSMDNGLIWGRNTTEMSGAFPAYQPTNILIPVEISHSNGVISAVGRLIMIANNWFVTVEYKTRSASYVTITPTQIDIPAFSTLIDSNLC